MTKGGATTVSRLSDAAWLNSKRAGSNASCELPARAACSLNGLSHERAASRTLGPPKVVAAYPAQFRQDYEREVVSVFRRQWERQPGAVWAWLFFLKACVSIVWNAPGEHLHMLTSDLSYAFRAFRRSPGFTAVAIATLALGMGVNAALFSVVKSVLYGTLPYDKPDQLVRVWIRNPKQGFDHDISNLPRLEDWRRAASFQGVAGFTSAK